MKAKSSKFSDVKIGQVFGCWGDTFLNYNYPKWCECIKIDEDTAQEIGGIKFKLNPTDIVTIKNPNL